MRSNVGAILLFLTLTLAAVGVTVIAMNFTGLTADDHSEIGTSVVSQPEIIGVTVGDISNRQAQSITLEIKGGSEPVNLSDTLITIVGEQGVQDLGIN